MEMTDKEIAEGIIKKLEGFKSDKRLLNLTSDFITIFTKWVTECMFLEFVVLARKNEKSEFIKAFNEMIRIMEKSQNKIMSEFPDKQQEDIKETLQ